MPDDLPVYLLTFIPLPMVPIYIQSPLFNRLKPPESSCKRQVPSPRRASIQPRAIKVLLCEKIPTLPRINAREIPVQDASPATGDGRCGVGRRAVEVRVPFFGYEAGFSGQGRGGVEGEHVDALNVFWVATEVGDVVDFVFEELDR